MGYQDSEDVNSVNQISETQISIDNAQDIMMDTNEKFVKHNRYFKIVIGLNVFIDILMFTLSLECA
jgi:hypothetical protein